MKNISLKVLNSYTKFVNVLKRSERIVCLTGAGVSSECGLQMHWGRNHTYRTFEVKEIATRATFNSLPSLVWEYYHYRRGDIFQAKPGKTHIALAKFEKLCEAFGKKFTLMTHNIDGLHRLAGSKNVIELLGSVDKVQCTRCKHVAINREHPICPALDGQDKPMESPTKMKLIEDKNLPRCEKCNGLLRPYVTFYEEELEADIAKRCEALLSECQVFIMMGTSQQTYPSAYFAPFVAKKHGIIAEFNILPQPQDFKYDFYFPGACAQTVPNALHF